MDSIGTSSRLVRAAAAAATMVVLLSSIASAREVPPFVVGPAPHVRPSPETAAIFSLKFQLPEGRGLAAQLLQIGVNQDDAARAARIAAGHLGDGAGGCSAKIEISQPVGATQFRLSRVELTTEEARTIIERHQGQLTLASATAISRHSPII